MNHRENNRDEISLPNELNTTATFQESSPFQSCTELATQTGETISIPSLGHPSPHSFVPKQPELPVSL